MKTIRIKPDGTATIQTSTGTYPLTIEKLSFGKEIERQETADGWDDNVPTGVRSIELHGTWDTGGK